MSKRKIAEYEKSGILVYLHQYIEKGYLPEALLNYLARLGWSFDATQEIFSRAELIEKFTLDRVNSSPASHDQDKLFWIEGEWMKTLPLERKIAGGDPVPRARGTGRRAASRTTPGPRIEAVIVALGDRLKVFSDILKLGRFFFTQDARLRPRRREETAAQGGRPGHAGRARPGPGPGRALRPGDPRKGRARLCRAFRTQDGRRGQSVAGGRHGSGRRARASTIASSSSAARRAGRRIRQTLEMLARQTLNYA